MDATKKILQGEGFPLYARACALAYTRLLFMAGAIRIHVEAGKSDAAVRVADKMEQQIIALSVENFKQHDCDPLLSFGYWSDVVAPDQPGGEPPQPPKENEKDSTNL